MARTDDPTAWPPRIKIDREVVGWCTGLGVLMLLGFPIMICAMFAEWAFGGYVIMEEDYSEGSLLGGLDWLSACGLLVGLAVAAGLLAGRTFARLGWRLLLADVALIAAWFGVAYLAS